MFSSMSEIESINEESIEQVREDVQRLKTMHDGAVEEIMKIREEVKHNEVIELQIFLKGFSKLVLSWCVRIKVHCFLLFNGAVI